MAGNKTSSPLIFLLFFLLLVIRIIHLSADPPYDLSTSGGPYGDPGGYSFNARNKILFGTWKIDDYNMMYLSYPPHLVTYFIFRAFGIGFAQQNLVPVFFSLGILILFFLILRKEFSGITAVLGTALLGINYLFLMYSRIANRIMPPIFFLLLGIYFINKGTKKVWGFVIAGISFFSALLSKSVIFYGLGAILMGYFVYALLHFRLKEIGKQACLLLAGALIPFLPWLLFIYIPNREFIHSFSQLNVQYLIPPKTLALVLRYFWTRPALLLQEMPIISVLSALASLVLLYKATCEAKKMSCTDWIFLSWFLIGWVYYAVIQQRVTRHFIPQIVPMIFLTVALGHHLLFGQKTKKRPGLGWAYAIVVFFWMLFPASLFLKFLAGQFPQIIQSQRGLNLSLIGLSFLATFLLILCMKLWVMPKKGPLPMTWKKSLVMAILLSVILLQGSKYLSWALHPPYQLKEASQDFGRAFQNATIAGLWAPVICLENKHRAHEYFQGYINDYEDFFDRFGITHVFTTTHHGENLIFEKKFPSVMKNAELLARYHIWTVEALLYDIYPKNKKGQNRIYEAELFTQKGSTPRFDNDASRQFAVLSRSKQPKFVAHITPDKELEKGRYQITFRMKKFGSFKNQKKRIARIDAVSSLNRKVLASTNLFAEDFSLNGYQDFSLMITLRRAQKIDLRIFTHGNGPFWIDQVKIEIRN